MSGSNSAALEAYLDKESPYFSKVGMTPLFKESLDKCK
jgi:hypothetical protein